MKSELEVRADLIELANKIIAESESLDVKKPTKIGIRRLRKLTLRITKIGKEYRKVTSPKMLKEQKQNKGDR